MPDGSSEGTGSPMEAQAPPFTLYLPLYVRITLHIPDYFSFFYFQQTLYKLTSLIPRFWVSSLVCMKRKLIPAIYTILVDSIERETKASIRLGSENTITLYWNWIIWPYVVVDWLLNFIVKG